MNTTTNLPDSTVPTGDKPDLAYAPLFQIGERFPFKGVWFEIDAITDKSITLRPIGHTKKDKKRRGL